MKILVTGFEPFGGAVINPAYEAVKLVDFDNKYCRSDIGKAIDEA